MKLVICTKFHVNRMNWVESRGWGGSDLPPIKASCNYFFFEASRVNDIFVLLFQLINVRKPVYLDLQYFVKTVNCKNVSINMILIFDKCCSTFFFYIPF